jgi:hypothetical protein
MRTPDQTIAGIFWCCDETPHIGTPPKMYNQIVMEIADQMGSDAVELARLLALVNAAMADGAIACFESKYYHDFWRPVTAIREADKGTGPTGLGDGNPQTAGDPNFTPLGSQASNTSKPNFTPPFPAYPAGHSTFGDACFQILRDFYGTDSVSFTVISDEFNGVTKDNTGKVRPLIPRDFASFSEAEAENGLSRIYVGVHWAFDNTEGIAQGRQIADYIFENSFRPLR